MREPHTRWVVALLVAVAAAWALIAAWLGSFAADSARMAAVFSSDEELIAEGLRRMVDEGSIYYGIRVYPGLYMNLSLLAERCLVLLGVDREAALVLGPRWVSSLGGAAAVVLTGWLATMLAGRRPLAGVLAAAILALTPIFFDYGMTAHPDTVQMAWCVAALIALVMYVEGGERRHLLVGAALAGAAFATKYAGAFLTPVVALAAVLWRMRSGATLIEALRNMLRRDAPATAGVFLLTAAVTSPTLVWYFAALRKGVAYQAARFGFGKLERSQLSGFHWLDQLTDVKLLGWPLAIVAALAVGLLAWVLLRDRTWLINAGIRAAGARGLLLGLTFVGLYGAYLLLASRIFSTRYLLPMAPVLAVAVAWSAVALLDRRVVAAALVVVLLLVSSPARIPVLGALARERLNRPYARPLELGPWLRERYADTTPILYDHYTYVPSEYRSVVATWGLSRGEIDRLRPKVIITNATIRDRYRVLRGRDFYGTDFFSRVNACYQRLEAGALLGYELVAAFPELDDAHVYARAEPPGDVPPDICTAPH